MAAWPKATTTMDAGKSTLLKMDSCVTHDVNRATGTTEVGRFVGQHAHPEAPISVSLAPKIPTAEGLENH